MRLRAVALFSALTAAGCATTPAVPGDQGIGPQCSDARTDDRYVRVSCYFASSPSDADVAYATKRALVLAATSAIAAGKSWILSAGGDVSMPAEPGMRAVSATTVDMYELLTDDEARQRSDLRLPHNRRPLYASEIIDLYGAAYSR